jgi:hypothetical protein
METYVVEKALKLACQDVADHQCPMEFDLANWGECKTCSKDEETHYDAERDANCWSRYYLQKAEEQIFEEMRQKVAVAPNTCPITGLRKCERYTINGNVVYLTEPAYDAYTLPEYDRESLSFIRIHYDMDDDNREEVEGLCDLDELVEHAPAEKLEEIMKIYEITPEEIAEATKRIESFKDGAI